jgi:hypothetical protein
VIKTSVPDLIIDHISGNCPVQSEGTIAGDSFYFRARGNRWTFEIGRTHNGMKWGCIESYGTDPYSAGYMTEEEALSFIESAATDYINGVLYDTVEEKEYFIVK